jgi:hypothetical protein
MTFKKGDPRPPNAGRKPGTPNKDTASVKALAFEHVPKALKILARLADYGESDAVKVSACKELLDRAIGKAIQPHAGEGGEGPVIVQVVTGVPRAE